MRLYVGGLPYQTTEKDLLDLFNREETLPTPRSSLIVIQGEAKALASLR